MCPKGLSKGTARRARLNEHARAMRGGLRPSLTQPRLASGVQRPTALRFRAVLRPTGADITQMSGDGREVLLS